MMKRIKDRFWYGCSCAYFFERGYVSQIHVRTSESITTTNCT
jgi:hypothetical protein